MIKVTCKCSNYCKILQCSGILMFLFNSQSDIAMEYWEQILQFTWGFHFPNFTDAFINHYSQFTLLELIHNVPQISISFVCTDTAQISRISRSLFIQFLTRIMAHIASPICQELLQLFSHELTYLILMETL